MQNSRIGEYFGTLERQKREREEVQSPQFGRRASSSRAGVRWRRASVLAQSIGSLGGPEEDDGDIPMSSARLRQVRATRAHYFEECVLCGV